MKRVKYTIVLLLVMLTVRTSGDIIINTYSPVKVCVRIENLKDYPDIVVVGLSDCITVFSNPKVEIIDSCSCVEVHKACPLTFYAVKKDYLEKKGIKNINWKKDKKVRKADKTVNANKVSVHYPNVEISEQNFFIAGFNENSMVIWHISQTNKFSHGTPDIVDRFLHPGFDLPTVQESLKLQKSF